MNNKHTESIRVTLDPSAKGGYTATIADRPGCISEGESVPDALRNLAEAVEVYDDAAPSIQDRYGGNNPRSRINRAIRAELPGGPQVLDAMTALRDLVRSRDAEPVRDRVHAALELLREAADQMEAEIRRRYGLQPAAEEE